MTFIQLLPTEQECRILQRALTDYVRNERAESEDDLMAVWKLLSTLTTKYLEARGRET